MSLEERLLDTENNFGLKMIRILHEALIEEGKILRLTPSEIEYFARMEEEYGNKDYLNPDELLNHPAYYENKESLDALRTLEDALNQEGYINPEIYKYRLNRGLDRHLYTKDRVEKLVTAIEDKNSLYKLRTLEDALNQDGYIDLDIYKSELDRGVERGLLPKDRVEKLYTAVEDKNSLYKLKSLEDALNEKNYRGNIDPEDYYYTRELKRGVDRHLYSVERVEKLVSAIIDKNSLYALKTLEEKAFDKKIHDDDEIDFYKSYINRRFDIIRPPYSIVRVRKLYTAIKKQNRDVLLLKKIVSAFGEEFDRVKYIRHLIDVNADHRRKRYMDEYYGGKNSNEEKTS